MAKVLMQVPILQQVVKIIGEKNYGKHVYLTMKIIHMNS